jgi:hypothetical protein
MQFWIVVVLAVVLLCLTLPDIGVEAKKGKGGKGARSGKSKKSRKSAGAAEVSVDADGEVSSEGQEPEPIASSDDMAAGKKEDEPDKKKESGVKSRFNKNIAVDKIEKAWEEGDSKEELEMEFEVNRRVGQRIQSKKVDMSDPTAIAKMFKKDPLAAVSMGGTP